MKVVFENNEDSVGIIIPADIIKAFINELANFLVVTDNMPDNVKQKVRSMRMMFKSALLVTGNDIRQALNITDKPSKNMDTVDWYSLAIADKIAQDAEKHMLIFKLEGTSDETPIVTQIYTKSI
jgi:hypothetical protein